MAESYECDACFFEVSGYSQRELKADGWRWVVYEVKAPSGALRKETFVMCNECDAKFELRRMEKAAAIIP